MFGELGQKVRTQGSILGVLPTQSFSIGAAASLNQTHFSPSLAALNWIDCSGTSANYTVTLPSPAGHAGQYIALRMDPALTKLVTIARNSADTIDGATSRLMWANESAILLTDGVNWFKVAGKSIPMSAYACRRAALTATNNTQIIVALDTLKSDNSGLMVDVTINHRINIVRGATYIVFGKITFAGGFNATQVQCNLCPNGTTAFIGQMVTGNVTGWVLATIASTIYNFATNDNVTVGVYQNSGSNQDLYVADDAGVFVQIVESPSW